MRTKILISICICLLLALGGIATASTTWVANTVGNWDVAGNWSGGVPNASSTSIGSGTCTLNTADGNCAGLQMGYAASQNGTLLIEPGAVLSDFKAGTTTMFSLSKISGAIGVVTQDGGSVYVSGGGAGELQLSSADGAIGVYTLNGGTLNTEVLNKGSTTRNGTFNANGGTLIIHSKIDKFGLANAGNAGSNGFTLSGTVLEPNGIGVVGTIAVGSSNATDFIGSSGGLDFDISGDTTNDKVTNKGNCTLSSSVALSISFLGSYGPTTPSTSWTLWDCAPTYSGSGLPTLSVPAGYSTSEFSLGWTTVGADTDLVLTYIPEPTTLVLLGLVALGLIRRRRS
ncbi:MAG: PEP-CTERM sorting domain-containing protein [Phycisphaerae bacterium]|jgi:hypothetical protein